MRSPAWTHTRRWLPVWALLLVLAACGEDPDEMEGAWEGDYTLRSKGDCAFVVEGHTLPVATGTLQLELDVEEGDVTGIARLGDVVVSTLEDDRLAACRLEEGPHEYTVSGARLANADLDAQLNLSRQGESGIELVAKVVLDGCRMDLELDDLRGVEGEGHLQQTCGGQ